MATALRYALTLCLILPLAGCFHAKRDIHTIDRASHHAISTHQKTRSYSAKTYHTVKKGDSLYKIGQQFGVPYRILAKRNHLRYPYTIYVGQKVYLSTLPHKTSKAHSSHYKKKKTKAVKKRHVRVAKKTPSHRATNIHLRWPVHGAISSPFGRRGSRMHDGIDIAVKDGTAVHAAASGTVVYADSRLTGYGKLIIIRHSNQLFTAYAHNQKLLVKAGDHVKSGQIISKSGHSGHSTGPHLHFEVRIQTRPVNPIPYLPKQ